MKSYGLPKINIHKEVKTLDALKKVSVNSCDTITSIIDGIKLVSATIAGNEATITSTDYSEGDKVTVWSYCFNPAELGGICSPGASTDWSHYWDI